MVLLILADQTLKHKEFVKMSKVTTTYNKAYFLEKSQYIPNKLIFDQSISSDAKVLMLAFNATPENWKINQFDMQKRLGFGRDQMRSAMKSAIKGGYLKVTQSRSDKSKFSHNVFDFSLKSTNIKPPQDMVSPKTARPSTVMTPLSYVLEEELCIEEQTNINVSLESSVCLFSKKEEISYEDPRAKAILDRLQVPSSYKNIIANKPFDEISQALAALEQWIARAECQEKKPKTPDELGRAMVKAVNSKWKPNETKEDKQKKQENERNEVDKKEENIRLKALGIRDYLDFEIRKNNCAIYVRNKYIEFKHEDQFYILPYSEENCIKKLKLYIHKYAKISVENIERINHARL